MPTNNERRNVARRLRNNAGQKPSWLIPWAVFNDAYEHEGAELINRLADLIEPEERTCYMRDASWDDGQCTWGCICSACGAKHEHKRSGWMNFCPNCGAKVVDDHA